MATRRHAAATPSVRAPSRSLPPSPDGSKLSSSPIPKVGNMMVNTLLDSQFQCSPGFSLACTKATQTKRYSAFMATHTQPAPMPPLFIAAQVMAGTSIATNRMFPIRW